MSPRGWPVTTRWVVPNGAVLVLWPLANNAAFAATTRDSALSPTTRCGIGSPVFGTFSKDTMTRDHSHGSTCVCGVGCVPQSEYNGWCWWRLWWCWWRGALPLAGAVKHTHQSPIPLLSHTFWHCTADLGHEHTRRWRAPACHQQMPRHVRLLQATTLQQAPQPTIAVLPFGNVRQVTCLPSQVSHTHSAHNNKKSSKTITQVNNKSCVGGVLGCAWMNDSSSRRLSKAVSKAFRPM